MDKQFILTNLEGDTWQIEDKESGYKVTFKEGRYNETRCVIPPEHMPEEMTSYETRQWAEKSLRAISRYLAVEHYFLASNEWPGVNTHKKGLKSKLGLTEEEREEAVGYLKEVNKDLGTAMRDLREYRGLSIEEVAERLSISPVKLEKIEQGRSVLNVHKLAKYLEALGGRIAIIPEESDDDPHVQFIEFE